MRRLVVVLTLAGCLAPPRGPAALPGPETPADWSLRRVQYDVGADGIATASGRSGIRVALVRRCRTPGHKDEVIEMRGRDDAIGPHLDRALRLWSGMPFYQGGGGCSVLQLVYLRDGGASHVSVEKEVPRPFRSQNAVLIATLEAHARCISCPKHLDLSHKAIEPGSTALFGCVSDRGMPESGTITRSGGEAADLVALWLFGVATYRPLVVDGQPRGFCAPFMYRVVPAAL